MQYLGIASDPNPRNVIPFNSKAKVCPGSLQSLQSSVPFPIHFHRFLHFLGGSLGNHIKDHPPSLQAVQVLYLYIHQTWFAEFFCQFALLSWPKKLVLLHPHPTKHGVTMSLSVSMAKIPAISLLTTYFLLWTRAGFTTSMITESLREEKISGPSQRRQSRSPGLLLQSFHKTKLKSLTVEFYVSYVLNMHIKFYSNWMLFTIQSINLHLFDDIVNNL